jgi:flagellar assembly protein FliH
MSKFKSSDFKINSEAADVKKFKVSEFQGNTNPVVKQFQFQELNRAGEGTYESVKSKYGPLAVTDAERSERSQKDRRFSLNPLLRGPLSVEEEEQRVIEEKVKAQIDAMTESARLKAADEGYQDGLKKGFEEAFKKFQEDSSQNVEKLQQLVISAENAKEEIFKANERFLIDLVYRISKMVLIKDLSLDREYVYRLARDLINRVGVRDNITLKINSEDSKSLFDLKEGLQKNFGELKNLNIEISSQVERGGCRLETEWNAIDANIETQLKGIYEALFGNNSGGEN